MSRQQARALAAVLLALSATVASDAVAQNGSYTRGANPNAPRLMVSAFKSDDKKLGPEVADAVRSRIDGDVSMRELIVIPKSDVDGNLANSGYSTTEALTPSDAVQLAKMINAAEYLEGSVTRTATGITVEVAVVLFPDPSMLQPLGTFSGTTLKDVAAQVSKAYQNAHRVFDNTKACRTAVRTKNFGEAQKQLNSGLQTLPKSVWLKVCNMEMVKTQSKPAADILAAANDILAIDPKNKLALSETVVQYDALGDKEKKIDAMLKTYQADPSNSKLQIPLVNALAEAGKFEMARPLVEKLLTENQGDVSLSKLYWLILNATKDWKTMLKIGDQLVVLDTAMADADFFDRSINAAVADSNSTKAMEYSCKAAGKFSKNAEYAAQCGQWQLRAGQTQLAIESLRRALAIDPKTKGARLIILKSYYDATQYDSVFAYAHEAVAAGEDPALVGPYVLQSGNKLLGPAQKREPKEIADFEKMMTFVNYADSLIKDPKTKASAKFLTGVANFFIGSIYYSAIPTAKNCADAKKAADAFLTAQLSLPAGGAFDPETTKQLMTALAQYMPATDAAIKQVCK